MSLDDATVLRLSDLNLVEFTRESARREPAGVLHEEGGLLLAAGGTPFPVMVNAAMRVDGRVSDAEVIERSEEFFAGLGRGHTIVVREHSEPSLLAAAEAAGYTVLDAGPWLVLDAPVPAAPDPEGCELAWATDVAGVADAADVAAEAFATLGLPPEEVRSALGAPELWLDPHVYVVVARDAEGPMATAMSFLSHGVGGVYWVGTRERGRGRGLGEAVTRWVSNAAFEAGARMVTLQASHLGDPIYRRMGYRQVGAHRWCVRFEPRS